MNKTVKCGFACWWHGHGDAGKRWSHVYLSKVGGWNKYKDVNLEKYVMVK